VNPSTWSLLIIEHLFCGKYISSEEMEMQYAKYFLGAYNLKLIMVHILSQDYSYSCKYCGDDV
jgi:hypothetical protein